MDVTDASTVAFIPSEKKQEIETLSFSQNGKFLALGGRKNVQVLDISDIQNPVSLFENKGETYQILFSPNSEQLALIVEKRCLVYALEKKELLLDEELLIHDEDDLLSFSMDSSMLAVGEQNKLSYWNTNDYSQREVIEEISQSPSLEYYYCP